MPRKTILCRWRQGMSLVEVLVVTLVASIIFAIAIPSLTNAQTYSRQKACEAQMAAIYQAEESYRARYRSYTTDLSSAGLNMQGGLPVCPLGTNDYTAIVSGSGPTQTVTIKCNNVGAHAPGAKWATSDGFNFSPSD